MDSTFGRIPICLQHSFYQFNLQKESLIFLSAMKKIDKKVVVSCRLEPLFVVVGLTKSHLRTGIQAVFLLQKDTRCKQSDVLYTHGVCQFI